MDPLIWTPTPTRGLAAWPDISPASAPRTWPSLAELCLTLVTLTGPDPDHDLLTCVPNLTSNSPHHHLSGDLGSSLIQAATPGPALLPLWGQRDRPWLARSSSCQPRDPLCSQHPGPEGEASLHGTLAVFYRHPQVLIPGPNTARGFPVLILQALYSLMVTPEEGGTFRHSDERNFPYSLSSSFPP